MTASAWEMRALRETIGLIVRTVRRCDPPRSREGVAAPVEPGASVPDFRLLLALRGRGVRLDAVRRVLRMEHDDAANPAEGLSPAEEAHSPGLAAWASAYAARPDMTALVAALRRRAAAPAPRASQARWLPARPMPQPGSECAWPDELLWDGPFARVADHRLAARTGLTALRPCRADVSGQEDLDLWTSASIPLGSVDLD